MYQNLQDRTIFNKELFCYNSRILDSFVLLPQVICGRKARDGCWCNEQQHLWLLWIRVISIPCAVMYVYIFMFEKVWAHKSQSKSYTSFLFLLLLFLLSLQSESRQSSPQYFDLSPQYLAEEVNLYPPLPPYFNATNRLKQ